LCFFVEQALVCEITKNTSPLIGYTCGCHTKYRETNLKVENESHMKHTITKLEGENEPIHFSHTTLGNCFLEDDHGCYVAQPSSFKKDEQSKLLYCTWNGANEFEIVEIYICLLYELNCRDSYLDPFLWI
jgi:hypothetical protein